MLNVYAVMTWKYLYLMIESNRLLEMERHYKKDDKAQTCSDKLRREKVPLVKHTKDFKNYVRHLPIS